MPSRVSLALAAVLSAGCGNGHEPSRPVSDLSLQVSATELEPGRRHILVLGDPGTVAIATQTTEGCLLDSPCSISVDVRVSSSNPDVVSLDRSTVQTPGTLSLRAHATGSATITARVGSLSASERVDVVASPPPLDALQITLEEAWNDLPTEYDGSGNLTWMSVPAGQTGALHITPLRDGIGVVGIQLTLGSSAPGVALATANCRPPSLDPNCGVYSDGWVMGMSPGEAEVTVTARNLTGRFTVQVVP